MGFRIRQWRNREVKQTKNIRYKQAALQWSTSWNQPEYKEVPDLRRHMQKECNPGRLRVGVALLNVRSECSYPSRRDDDTCRARWGTWERGQTRGTSSSNTCGAKTRGPVSDEGEDGPEAAHVHSRHLVP